MAGRLQTVAFVDVEASTELLTRAGDDRGVETIERVLDVARQRIEPYGGTIIKTLGDGLMTVFESPRSAISFAVAVQQALGVRRPRLRVGIHVGETIGPAEDPTGETVSAAARITDKADGGEIVVSEIVRGLAGSMPRVRFVDRGRTSIRGFVERFRLHRVVASEEPAAPPPVFGRDEELHFADERLAALDTGGGQILLVEGEAGIGKTHLVQVIRARAASRGAMVVTGRADELEQDRPGRILLGLADGLGADLDPAGGGDDSGVIRGSDPAYAVVERFIDALEDAAATGPVVLVVEDLHWADELSLRGIAAAARRVAPIPVGLLGTLRPSPRSPYLHRVLELCESAGASTVTLSGLDDAGVTGLVASLTGAAPGPSLRSRLQTTEGNPLFVTELIRALDDNGALRVEGGVTDIDEAGLPEELIRMLSRRVSTLPADTVELLRLASLLGGEFALSELAAIAGRSVVDVAGSLGHAVDAALVGGDGDHLTFRHDLIREAVYEEIAPAIRADLHLSAARSLAATDAPASQVARQFALGARPGDVEAATWLASAGREVSNLDTAAAANLLEQAVTIAPPDWSDRVVVESQLVPLLAHAGRVVEAEEIAEAMLHRSLTSPEQLAARRALASVLGLRGRLGEAAGHLRQAMELEGLDEVERGVLECAAAGMSVIAGSTTPAEAKEVARAHLDAEDPTLACWAHHTSTVSTVAAAEYDEMLDHARAAWAILDTAYVPPLGFLTAPAMVPTAYFHMDDAQGARSSITSARRWADERGELGQAMQMHTVGAGLGFTSGDWDSAASEADAGLALADETGNVAQTMFFHSIASLVALGRGQRERSEEHLTSGEEFFASGSHHLFGLDMLIWARSQMLEDEGQPDAARGLLEEAWHRTANLRGLIQWRHLGPDLIRLARSSGDFERAGAIAHELEELASRSSSRAAAATAARGRGLAEADPDQLVSAVRLFRDTMGRTQHAAAAEEAAALLLESDRRDDAVAMLEEAEALHDSMGADAHVGRVHETLLRAGVGRQRSSMRATHGWESLSPKELEVVELVAQGLSNPQIGERLYISRRTVETHLTHIFQKLDLSNRTELAATALRRSSPDL